MPQLTVLSRDPNCALCDLSGAAHSICIPAELMWGCTAGQTDQCVYILSDKIGYAEDQAGRNFAGESRAVLDAFYVHGAQLNDYADIWAGNATRCVTPKDMEPSRTQLKACAAYWRSDLGYLAAKYRRVVLLLAGTHAARIVTGGSVADFAARQGISLEGLPPNVSVFCTYNPAYCLREPTIEARVIPVLVSIRELLEHGQVRVEEMPAVQLSPIVPAGWCGPVCFDLETDGCLIDGRQQTFHPRKIEVRDGVSYDKQIVCASICWRDSDGQLNVGYFDWRDVVARQRFAGWLGSATEIWGQNLAYDVKLIRACLPGSTLSRDFGLLLRDLLAESFLYDDLQERGLKYLAWACRVAHYGDEQRAVRAYVDAADPKLILYACKDAWSTYRCIELFRQWQREKFGGHVVASSKCAAERDGWYSDQLWAAVLMEEAGQAFSLSALREVHERVCADYARVAAEALQLGVVVGGPGSDASKREVMREAVNCAAGLSSDAASQERLSLLEMTKEGEYCIHADNRNVVLGLLPLDNEQAALHARKLGLLAEAASLDKIRGSYTEPLLYGKVKDVVYPLKWAWSGKPGRPRKDGRGLTKSTVSLRRVADKSRGVELRDKSHVLIEGSVPDVGLAYPSIYTLPRAGEGGHDKSGGVRQFRWSMKQPALQTLPELVWNCLTSRWAEGVLFKADLAQVEWRGAAFLSGDAAMQQEIADDVDIHSRTASALLGVDITDDEVLTTWAESAAGRRALCAAPSLAIRQEAQQQMSGSGCLLAEWVLSKKGVRGWLRQNMGKSQNFAWLYGGTVGVVIATCRVKAGIEVPLSRAAAWYDGLKKLYPQRARWETALLDSVLRDHALHLPLLGQSRSFCADADAVLGKYRPQIMDFPVQCTASNLMVGVIIQVTREFSRRGMRSVVSLNVHDALVVDAPLSELAEAVQIVRRAIRSTPYRQALEAYYGRSFPLDYEMDIVALRGCTSEQVAGVFADEK